VAVLEEKRANAQGGQAGLATRKAQLTEELSRVSAERPDAATQTQEYKASVSAIQKRLDEQRTKSLAEEKGVEGTGKVGRGQFWRASKSDEAKIEAELQVAQDRLRNHESRLISIDKRTATIQAELAQIDGALAKLKGEERTATQMIDVAKPVEQRAGLGGFDPASAVSALERDRQAFRIEPKQSLLTGIQQKCSALQDAGFKVPSIRDEAAKIDCDPKQANEAAARLFALNDGLVAFEKHCVGGEKLPQSTGVGGLLTFGRKCLQDSGLSGKDAAEFGARLSAIDLNRDDKAHRFVVTWNAFNDGNRLAYLALAIAIAIDGLVFMSGLFGANAVSSPLTGTPQARRRAVTDLHKELDNALSPPPSKDEVNKLDVAELVLNVMHPVKLAGRPQHTALVDLDHVERRDQRFAIRRVLAAGADLELVEQARHYDQLFLVRRELRSYLGIFADRERRRGAELHPEFSMPEFKAHPSLAAQFLREADQLYPPPALPRFEIGGPRAMRDVSERGTVETGFAPPMLGQSNGTKPVAVTRRLAAPSPVAPSAPRSAPPQAANDVTFGNLTASVGPTDAERAELCLRDLGLTWGDVELLQSHELENAITRTTDALHAVIRSDPKVGGHLETCLRRKDGLITSLTRRNPSIASWLEELRSQDAALLLFGDRGYKAAIDGLDERSIQESEGVHPQRSELLIKNLHAHSARLAQVWPLDRSDSTTWRVLAEEIERFADNLAHLEKGEIAKERAHRERADTKTDHDDEGTLTRH
jgi:hypothetical protein